MQVDDILDKSIVEQKQNGPLHEVMVTEYDNIKNVIQPAPRPTKVNRLCNCNLYINAKNSLIKF